MPNMESIITKHNNKILNKKVENHERLCNCREKPNCLIEENYLTKFWCTKPKLIVCMKQNTILEQQKIRLKQGITTTKSPLSIACMKRKKNCQNISGN